MKMVGLENAFHRSVIASEREATQLMAQNRAQRDCSTLENSASWVASLFARNDELGSCHAFF